MLGTGLLKACDYTVGRSGLTEEGAASLGLETVCALLPTPDHAHYYGGARNFAVKLVGERPSGRLLGVQLVGAGEVAGRLSTRLSRP